MMASMTLRLSILCVLYYTCSALPTLVSQTEASTIAQDQANYGARRRKDRRRKTPPAPPPPTPPVPPPAPPVPPPPTPTPPGPNSCVVKKTMTNMTLNRMNPAGFTFNGTVYFAGGQVCADAVSSNRPPHPHAELHPFTTLKPRPLPHRPAARRLTLLRSSISTLKPKNGHWTPLCSLLLRPGCSA